MKKVIVCLLACLNLGACVYAGDFDLLPIRKKMFNLYKGYSISFYDNEEEVVSKERVHENDYQLNKAITVRKGEDVLSDVFMDKVTYQRFFVIMLTSQQRRWVYAGPIHPIYRSRCQPLQGHSENRTGRNGKAGRDPRL